MSYARILIAEDEPITAEFLRELLISAGYEVAITRDGQAAIRALPEFQPDVVLTDLEMPELDGFGVLSYVRENNPDVPVIILTGQGTADNALRAIQTEGAYHFFTKPYDIHSLLSTLKNAVAYGVTLRENENLKRQLSAHGTFGELVGNSERMREIYSLIEQVAPSSASVLITGESGTGKEVAARTIHLHSPRRTGQFVAINCAAIPESLMESELFGHEKGAFTGAMARRQGCFELAHGGTLLLDEIAEMPPLLQSKLLRVLEERQVRRVGGSQLIPVDVRVIAATNKNPAQAVQNGSFREDLLYRLNVITLDLPPLRERKSDIPLLAQHLLTKLAEKHQRPARMFHSDALTLMQDYAWHGNVRELRNCIERAVIICPDEEINRSHIAPLSIEQRKSERPDADTIAVSVGTTLAEMERIMIYRTLRQCDNNKTRAAKQLGISLKTLHNKINSYRTLNNDQSAFD